MILDDLYNGKLHPAEQFASRDSRYVELSRKISDQLDMLEKGLPKEQIELVEQLQEAMYDLFAYENQENFKNGFVMGAKFMQEVNNSPYASQ